MTIIAERAALDAGTPRALGPAPAFALFALVLAALALCLPIDHDEGQYVGPFALAGHLKPFADFTYLQTPLQLYLTQPLAGLARGWALVALRLFNAAMALGELGLIYAVQRRLGTPAGRALIACGLLLMSYPFEFASVVARNDVLPALLEAAAILAGTVALERPRGARALWVLAGLALGAGASAKVSYALPTAGMGLWLLWSAWKRRAGLLEVIGFGLGGLIGLVPAAVALLGAPDNFIWGVLTFAHAAAPWWYRAIGLGYRLTLPRRLAEGAFHLAVGPALAMLVGVVATGSGRKARADASPAIGLLQVMALAGLIAALAPSPMQRQYFMPMLVPLAVLWGVQDPLKGRRWLMVLTVAGLAIGVGRAGYVVGDAGVDLAKGRPPPAIALTEEAHWIGRTLKAQDVSGDIASPSPQAVLDSGARLDPRFSSGAFAYRSGDMLSDEELRRLHLTSPRTLARDLDAAPPGAILTGYEPPSGHARRNIDDDFRAYARSRGYRRLASPDGVAELWIKAPSAGSPAGRPPSRRPGS
jgi:hypothetical protein